MGNNEVRLSKMNNFLVQTVESISELQIFEDFCSEDNLKEINEKTGGWNYFIYETSGFSFSQDKSQLKQTVLLRFYSENRDDLDTFSLRIIHAISGKLFKFSYSQKSAIQKGKQDSYVDEIEFYFTRTFKYGC